MSFYDSDNTFNVITTTTIPHFFLKYGGSNWLKYRQTFGKTEIKNESTSMNSCKKFLFPSEDVTNEMERANTFKGLVIVN